MMTDLGPDRTGPLRAALHALRDRLTVDEIAHFGAQLPLLVRGIFCDAWRPAGKPDRIRSEEEFFERVAAELSDVRRVNIRDAVRSVTKAINLHVSPGELDDLKAQLPEKIWRLWPEKLMPEARVAEVAGREPELASATETGSADGWVRDAMTRDVELISPDLSVHEASRRMAKADIGALLVGEHHRLVGMITDRDVAVRVVAANLNPAATIVREAMTASVELCFDGEDVGAVAERMSENKLRRLPVVNCDKRLVGILSVGDLAREEAGARDGDCTARRRPTGRPACADRIRRRQARGRSLSPPKL